MILYRGHLENPIWPPSAAFLNSTVVFIGSNNIWLETRQQILRNHDFDRVLPRSSDIDRIRFLHCGHLENLICRKQPTYVLGNITTMFSSLLGMKQNMFRRMLRGTVQPILLPGDLSIVNNILMVRQDFGQTKPGYVSDDDNS